MSTSAFSFNRLLQSFRYAFKGIRMAYTEGQVNIKIHSVIAIFVIALSIYLSINEIEWAIIIGCIGIVISAEMINTSIESLVDLVSPEWNEKAGKVKDIAAGAVLVLAMMSIAIGIMIFLPKILALL
jgi:diacylglycerol kinase (ATP)